jgi:uncharacterized protein YrrD
MKMELKEGTTVFTPGGDEVGRINRFVLDPATGEVTHVVIQKGWLFPEDKVVPIAMVGAATDERVLLNQKAEDFDDLPPFEETHYVELNEEDLARGGPSPYRYAPAYYWYPPSGLIGGYPAMGPGFYGLPPLETTRNIPADTVPLREGADVMSSNGEHVGDVERLVVDRDSNRATHFVISAGLLFKERKLIPANWVKSVEEEKVYLSVPSRVLERLPEYAA